jgi:ribosomal protein S18 acetylase RimI-like enzyme
MPRDGLEVAKLAEIHSESRSIISYLCVAALNFSRHTRPMSSTAQDVTIRRTLRPGDAGEIADLHDRVYRDEYGLDGRFRASVAQGVEEAVATGWPDRSGAVWLIDGERELAGSLGLTVIGDDIGQLRWFVLAPELRGRRLGQALVAELVEEARAAGMRGLVLETFSALTTAAHIYRGLGFRVVREQRTNKWGPNITYQRYELALD